MTPKMISLMYSNFLTLLRSIEVPIAMHPHLAKGRSGGPKKYPYQSRPLFGSDPKTALANRSAFIHLPLQNLPPKGA